MIATPEIQQRMSVERPRYLSCADTAKMLRKALRRAFPGVTFSVRKTSHSAVSVRWTDGPRPGRVEDVCEAYRAADFDGMIDLESSRYHWLLPDGSVQLARIMGTEGSRGTIPSSTHAKPHDDAELVHLGAKYISTSRHYSRRMLEKAAAVVATIYGCAPAEVVQVHDHHPSYGAGADVRPVRYDTANFADLAWRALREQNGPIL
jgi:hypothetical protein